jgi:hypothetical protein
MKKIIINLFLFIFILLIILITILSTVGIETTKFNKLISDKISQNKNINLELSTIKFKINPKELSLFIETQNPEITYKKIFVPVKNVKVFIDFLPLLKSDLKIKKTTLVLEELDITQLNKLSLIIKPSNYKTILNNKIKKGKVISEIEIFLTDQGTVKNFIAKGTVKDLKVELFSDFNLTKFNLSFFADKNDILIKSVNGNFEDIKISDGDVKLNLENGIKLESNFHSNIDLDEKLLKKYSSLLNEYKFSKNIKNLKAKLFNSVFVELDSTYKIKNYNYDLSGLIENIKFQLSNPFKNNFITKQINEIYLSDFKISTNFKSKKINLKGEGKYSFDNMKFLNVNLENNFNKDIINLKFDFDYADDLEIDLINYKKNINSIANLSINLEKIKNKIKINEVFFKDKKDLIEIKGLVINDNKLLSFKKIDVKTKNNDFFIRKNKKIYIKGNKFDATNLAKYLKNNNEENKFKNISSNIEIDFKDILVPLSEKLRNFKLLGEIKNGQFVKISSKGDFGGNNHLDISMKKDKKSDKKYLEVYSDLTRPLLTEYSFFNGLSGGKLLFTSIIDARKSNSKLKIENFKVINAPGLIRLLSLADLGGLADLAEGEGLSFDVLEIDMEKNNDLLKLNEILALGPSISVLMEGYQETNGLTSLRGTLVPAKTLNKMISKIPVIGNIVIPKEVGEGLFGISFKMKGPNGKIKTTINPIRTLTPRFIQKIMDRDKKAK